MADIVFNKDGNKWVAEFEVSADFNLHIEKPQIGYLYMQQRSTSGKWDSVHKFQVADSDYIVDYDFAALVYPKQIRLVSEYAPTMCALTSDGDVIEIKSQSKEVEITQNGEMSVTPDDGFAYLSSVNVKTNVPQQGGGESGGGSSSESEWLYFRLADMESELEMGTAILASSLTRTAGNEITTSAYSTMQASNNPLEYITHCAVDMGAKLFIQGSYGNADTMCQLIVGASIYSLPQITKEEFYNLES